MTLAFKILKSAHAVTIKLSGHIDEESGTALHSLEPKLPRLHLVFDCMDVRSVNSFGFRQWLQFLQRLAAHFTFDFVNCPQTFLDYSGLLRTTAFASRIASFQVPFRCVECARETVSIFEVDAVDPDAERFEPGVCAKCNGIARATVTPADCLTALR